MYASRGPNFFGNKVYCIVLYFILVYMFLGSTNNYYKSIESYLFACSPSELSSFSVPQFGVRLSDLKFFYNLSAIFVVLYYALTYVLDAFFRFLKINLESIEKNNIWFRMIHFQCICNESAYSSFFILECMRSWSQNCRYSEKYF